MSNPTTHIDDCTTYTAGGGPGANLPTGATGYFFQDPSNWQITNVLPAGSRSGQGFQYVGTGGHGSLESWVWSKIIDGNAGNCDYTCDFYVDTTGLTLGEFLVFLNKPVATSNPPTSADYTNSSQSVSNYVRTFITPGVTATTQPKIAGGPSNSPIVTFGLDQGIWFQILMRVQGAHVSIAYQALTGANAGKWLNISGSFQTALTFVYTSQCNYFAGLNGGIGFGMYSQGSAGYFTNFGWSPAPTLFGWAVTNALPSANVAPLIVPTAYGQTTLSMTAVAPLGGAGGNTYFWNRRTSANGTIAVVSVNSLTLADTGLTANTQYFYECVATDSSGATCTSPQVSFFTLSTGRTATTYYVDSAAGSDGTGTQGSPFNSFTGNAVAAFASLVPGDTINLVGGAAHANYTGPLNIANAQGLPGSKINIRSTDASGVPITTNLATIANSGQAAGTNHTANGITLTDCQYVTVNYVAMQGPGLDNTHHTISTTNAVSGGGSAGLGALAGHGVLLDSATLVINPTITNLGQGLGADWFGHRLQGNTVSNCTIDGFYEGIMLFAPGNHTNVGTGMQFYLINFMAGQDGATVANNTITNCAGLGMGTFAETYHLAGGLFVDPATDPNSVSKAERINGVTQINTNISRYYLHRQCSFTGNIVVNCPGDYNGTVFPPSGGANGVGYVNTYTGCCCVISNIEGCYLSLNALSVSGIWCYGTGGPLNYFCMNGSYINAETFASTKGTSSGGDGGGFDIDDRSIQCRLGRCVTYQELGSPQPGIGIELVQYSTPSVGAIIEHCVVYADPKTIYTNAFAIRPNWLNNTIYTAAPGALPAPNVTGWPQLVANCGFVGSGAGTTTVTLDANNVFTHNGFFGYSGSTFNSTGGSPIGSVTGDPLLANRATPPPYATSAPWTPASSVIAWTGVDPTTGGAWGGSGVDVSTLAYTLYVPTVDLHGVALTGFDIGAVNAGLTPATSFAISLSASSGGVNEPITVTITPNGGCTSAIVPTIAGITGTYSPTTRTWTGDASAKTYTFTPTSVGSGNINAVATSPSLTAPANVPFTSLAVTAIWTQTQVGGNLVGTNTDWTSGTTFTVTSPSGPTIASKVFTDATHYYLLINTAGHTGNFVVSDGENSYTINVPSGSGGGGGGGAGVLTINVTGVFTGSIS